MKTKLYILSVLAFLGAMACNKVATDSQEEKPQEVTPKGVYSIQVSLPDVGNETKTNINQKAENNFGLYWENGDRISVDNSIVSDALEGIDHDTKTVDFSFSEMISMGDHFVRCPGVASGSLTIPANQTSEGGMYDPASNPLWGKLTVSEDVEGIPSASLRMSNIMAMLKVNIKGDKTLIKATIEAAGGESMNGTYASCTLIDGFLSLSDLQDATARTTISFGEGLVLDSEGKNLYMPVIPQNYSQSFVLHLYDSEGKLMRAALTLPEGYSTLHATNLASWKTTYSGGRSETLAELGTLTGGNASFDESSLPENAIKVGSYNILRADNRGKDSYVAATAWDKAKSKVAGLAVAMDCDIIGFNELSDDSVIGFKDALEAAGATGYTFSLAHPNADGAYDFANGLAWKNDKFDVMSEPQMVLIDEESGSTRTLVWAKFKQKSTNTEFYYAITHLPTDAEPNLDHAKKLAQWISENFTGEAKVILCGDLNASNSTTKSDGKTPANKGFLYLTGKTTGDDTNNGIIFTDARNQVKSAGLLAPSEYNMPGTCVTSCTDGEKMRQETARLDHIMYINCTSVNDYRAYRNTYVEGGFSYFPSDHLPISAAIVL